MLFLEILVQRFDFGVFCYVILILDLFLTVILDDFNFDFGVFCCKVVILDLIFF